MGQLLFVDDETKTGYPPLTQIGELFMSKKMLIDALHPEETRVVVLENGRVEELDVDTQNKKQIKGNIYLAKVVRVEPSLQACFSLC